MLNQLPSEESDTLNNNIETQQKPRVTLVPDVNDKHQSNNGVITDEQHHFGNEPINLSSKDQEYYLEVLENPPEPSPEVINEFKRYLKRKI